MDGETYKLIAKGRKYDALVAELAGYKESHDKYCPSAERVRALEETLQTCRGALADIGNSTDMDKGMIKRKALRIYQQTAPQAETSAQRGTEP
jgi:hypothetical protein